MFRVGFGYDVHKLVENRPLIIGGVKIEYELGLAGHSDADVLLHAITDALLGAAGLGDIGTHFPPSDMRWRNADSRELLRIATARVREAGYSVNNIDSTIVAERPGWRPHIPAMRETIAADLAIEQGQVSVKAKTTEGLGFTGTGEGMAAYAVALVVSGQ